MADKKDLAYQDYLEGMKYKDIAAKYDVTLNTVKSWKKRYSWSRDGVHTKQKSVHTKKRGAPKGNKNALGNNGGAPEKNQNANKHGFFSKIFPDDEETLSIVNDIQVKSPLEMLWENIVIQYAAIARAQKIMFVKNQDDTTEHLKKKRSAEHMEEEEYEIQFAWDKQANFLAAQSRAIATLQNLIDKYEKMLPSSLANEEQRLKLEKLKSEINNLKLSEENNKNTDDWKDALLAVAEQRKRMKNNESG